MADVIAQEQIQSFHDNGYLIFRELASEQETGRFRAVAERDLEAGTGPVEYEAEVAYPGAPASLAAPGGNTVRRLRQAYSRDAALAGWGLDKRVAGRLRQLFSESEVLLVQNHHNCIMTKLPRYSSETHWHQDNRYWSYAENNLITVWLALGHEEQANGGMYLIPGSHRMDFSDDRYDKALFLREDLERNQSLIEQAVLAELEPGDALFFHSNLFHAAGRNVTAKSKFALVFTYRTAGNQPLDPATGTDDIVLPSE
jgi:phytanoyl-CoA hydroxylase